MKRRPDAPARVGRREAAAWILLAAASSTAMLWLWAWQIANADWAVEAQGPLTALLHGHIATFFASAPAYGPSLLLRAPFALPASLAGAGQLLIYRLAALPCTLALAALGAWLACELRRAGAGVIAAGATLLLCAVNPIAFKALVVGHPEELLGAALCAAAVLLASRGRAAWAGLALGLAIANKQWALLAVGPVLLALPARHWRALAIAGVVAIGLEAPILLSTATVAGASSRLLVNDTGTLFHPWQIFWFFGPRGHWLPAMAPLIQPGFRLPPTWLGGRAHLLIVGASAPLTLVAWRRGLRGERALALLALLFVLRCWLDPWDFVYYPLALIIALASWEAAVLRRFPVAAAAATAATWLIFDYLPGHIGLDAQALSFLVPATLALAALAVAVYRPQTLRLPRRAAISPAPAVPS